jgi:hypothetical protein
MRGGYERYPGLSSGKTLPWKIFVFKTNLHFYILGAVMSGVTLKIPKSIFRTLMLESAPSPSLAH